MARGDVLLVSLPDSDKREEKGNRPAIAVQTDVAVSPVGVKASIVINLGDRPDSFIAIAL
jgi:mRNA interferase MazF